MDRNAALGPNYPVGSTDPGIANAGKANARIESAAQAAHRTVDQVADKATAQVGRLSGTAHHAVDSAAETATSATAWASSIPEQAKQVQTQLAESVSDSIRARPLVTVLGALTVGYLLGRLTRF